MDFAAMAKLCAPTNDERLLARIATVESGFDALAIGVVGGRLQRQPRTLTEALATVASLKAAGWNYSLGMMQINQKNFARFGLTPDMAFDPCVSLRVAGAILQECQKRAGGADTAEGDALSCYYTGNLKRGYRLGYVARVLGADPNHDANTMSAVPMPSLTLDGPSRNHSPTRAAPGPFAHDEGLIESAARTRSDPPGPDTPHQLVNPPSSALLF